MTHNTELLLKSICKNADMGRDSLKNTIAKCRDNDFREVLKQQYRDTERIYISASALLGSEGQKPSSAPATAKMMANAMIAAAAVTASQPDRYAEMVVHGNQRGIKEITDDLAKYESADARAKNLALCLRDRLISNNNELQKYL